MVKPEKFGHLHLVYHFAVPSNYPEKQNVSTELEH